MVVTRLSQILRAVEAVRFDAMQHSTVARSVHHKFNTVPTSSSVFHKVSKASYLDLLGRYMMYNYVLVAGVMPSLCGRVSASNLDCREHSVVAFCLRRCCTSLLSDLCIFPYVGFESGVFIWQGRMSRRCSKLKRVERTEMCLASARGIPDHRSPTKGAFLKIDSATFFETVLSVEMFAIECSSNHYG